MNVDRFLPPTDASREASATTFDPLDVDGEPAYGPSSGLTDRISLGAAAVARLASLPQAAVMINDYGEGARTRIDIGGRTLTFEDGIYSLR